MVLVLIAEPVRLDRLLFFENEISWSEMIRVEAVFTFGPVKR